MKISQVKINNIILYKTKLKSNKIIRQSVPTLRPKWSVKVDWIWDDYFEAFVRRYWGSKTTRSNLLQKFRRVLKSPSNEAMQPNFVLSSNEERCQTIDLMWYYMKTCFSDVTFEFLSLVSYK